MARRIAAAAAASAAIVPAAPAGATGATATALTPAKATFSRYCSHAAQRARRGAALACKHTLRCACNAALYAKADARKLFVYAQAVESDAPLAASLKVKPVVPLKRAGVTENESAEISTRSKDAQSQTLRGVTALAAFEPPGNASAAALLNAAIASSAAAEGR